jgi:phosphopantetheinyl transferase
MKEERRFRAAMTTIHWSFSGFSESELNSRPDDWRGRLGDAELVELGRLRLPKRRAEWLAARLAAKQLYIRCHPKGAGVPEADLQVGKEDGGKPFLRMKGVGRLPGCLSMSHSQGKVFCALSHENSVQFGVDVERIEPRARGMIQDFFTAGEIAAIVNFKGHEHLFWMNLIWSAKEAFLKAIGCGLRMDTRTMEVLPDRREFPMSGWSSLRVHAPRITQNVWHVLFRREEGYVLSLCRRDSEDTDLQRWE